MSCGTNGAQTLYLFSYIQQRQMDGTAMFVSAHTVDQSAAVICASNQQHGTHFYMNFILSLLSARAQNQDEPLNPKFA
jgi:hypothetical protein